MNALRYILFCTAIGVLAGCSLDGARDVLQSTAEGAAGGAAGGPVGTIIGALAGLATGVGGQMLRSRSRRVKDAEPFVSAIGTYLHDAPSYGGMTVDAAIDAERKRLLQLLSKSMDSKTKELVKKVRGRLDIPAPKETL